MTRSSTRQPVPSALAGDLSKGYLLGSGSALPYEYTLHRPAGAMATTSPDLARFMMAQLEDGAVGSGRILRPKTVRAMQASPAPLLPPLHAMALGFYQHDRNGHRVLAHDGDTRVFHSQLNLFVDDDVGIFVSLNSSGRDGAADILRATLFQGFADRYFPTVGVDRAVDRATAKRHALAMAGHYEPIDRSETNFLAINAFRHQTVVEVDENGDLAVPDLTGADGGPKRWREIAPFVWREAGGQERLAARLVDGRPVRFSVDDYAPLVVWDRVPWWKSTGWLEPLARTALAILLLTVITIPARAAMRWRRGLMASTGTWQRRKNIAIWLAALAGVLVPTVWLRTIEPVMTFTADPRRIGVEIIAASVMTLFAYAGGLMLILSSSRAAWRDRGWITRLWSASLMLSFAALLWIAWLYKLLSFRTDF